MGLYGQMYSFPRAYKVQWYVCMTINQRNFMKPFSFFMITAIFFTAGLSAQAEPGMPKSLSLKGEFMEKPLQLELPDIKMSDLEEITPSNYPRFRYTGPTVHVKFGNRTYSLTRYQHISFGTKNDTSEINAENTYSMNIRLVDQNTPDTLSLNIRVQDRTATAVTGQGTILRGTVNSKY